MGGRSRSNSVEETTLQVPSVYQSAKTQERRDNRSPARNTSTGFISSQVHMELTPSNIRELNDVMM